MENRKRPSPFTIDNLLSSPAKRGFFIADLIEEDQPLQQGKGRRAFAPYSTEQLESYIKEVSADVQHSSKFRCVQTKSSYSIEDVPEDATGFVAFILQLCVEKALADSRALGIKADHLGCVISSPLLSHDIWHPIRPITADTIPSLLERFNEIAQSKEQEGVTLWGEPFNVTVTTLDNDGLPIKRKLTGGGRRKNLAPVHHRIHSQCLIKVNSNF